MHFIKKSILLLDERKQDLLMDIYIPMTIPIKWRVFYYVLPFEIFYIPAFLQEVKSKKARMIFFDIFIVMYTVITMWGMTQNNWYNAVPYNYYFNFM